ncbi:cadherin-like domain-containing protein [Anabaena sphaerica FACHB-251]|uniref:Cadherin-like domain-containing protein n=1 Tax=Anabaena sphaerica FACHB-251 TaxID=2692883 RepID=A0A927A064_9NOST|nr:Ig-like domain-containing protein [Anabaena sphaerica]MBD2293314.1 cadherin-like domain-containing protein [Anabaena sphaerica FACHB-251]
MANNDLFTTTQNTPLVKTVAELVSNDTDLPGDALFISSIDTTSSKGGTIIADDNGTPNNPFDDKGTYTPPTGFIGTDTFKYTANNGQGGTLEVTVTVEVTEPNLPPTAGDDFLTTTQNTPLIKTVAELVSNDTDSNADPLFISSFDPTSEAGGTIVADDNGTPDNPFDDKGTYTPATGFLGQDTFKYTVNDSKGGTSVGTVTVNVLAPDNTKIINGTPDNDELFAQQGDEVFGLEGNDILDAVGGNGNNTLDGGVGNDELFANHDDILIGGVGQDNLFAVGIAGNNSLDGGEDDDLLVVVEGNNNILTGDAGNDELYVIEGSLNILNGGIGNDKLIVQGGTGENTLEGGDGDDILIGLLASDRLFGEVGNDSLFAGKQGSQMTGGDGLDRFYLGNGSVPDVPGEVLDFTIGVDKVIIAGIPQVQSYDNIILEQVGADTIVKALIDGSEREFGILRGINKDDLTSNDFGFIIPVFSIANASAVEGNAITFTITRTDDILADQTITVTTSIAAGDTASASDFTANTQTLTFAQGETQKTFTVQTTQDALFEGDETFTVTLSNATNGSVISSTNGTAQGTITDDEPGAVFAIAAASAEEEDALTFTITRTGDAQAQQSVTVSTSINTQDTASDDDFTPKTETLTFAVGETEKTFTVETAEDFRVEENETFTVNLSSATNGGTISSTNGTAKGTINDDDIPLAAITNNNIFTIKGIGNTVRLKATLLASSSSVVNELGVFTVDDAEGRINGIAPGQAGYNEAALERAKNQGKGIFSAIANLPDRFKTEIEADKLTRLLGFNSGSHLKFFLVRESTIDAFQAGKISSTNIIFAESSTQIITQEDDSFTLSWKESSTVTQFNSLVVKVESTNESLTTGTALQGSNQAELIDFSGITGTVKADFSVFREAAYNNEVYFYKVDTAQGEIGGLQATAANRANYLQAAINNLIKDVNSGTAIKFAVSNQGLFTDSAVIAGGSILAPMIIVNGSLSQLTDSNTGNDPQVYFPYLGVNSDGVDHIRLLGDNTFGFEDLPGGGDLDYNDIIIKFDFSIV